MKSIANFLGNGDKEIKLYHSNGEIFIHYHPFSDGTWIQSTNDCEGRETSYKNSDGFWSERTYNDAGKELTYKNSKGYWCVRTYNDDGKELTYKNSDGFWIERTYDDEGNEMTFRSSEGDFKDYRGESIRSIADELGSDKEEIKLYHKNGKIFIEYKKSPTSGNWYEYTYDENGNCLRYKENRGHWEDTTYSVVGSVLTYKNSKGYWENFTYDDNGNVLAFRNSNGTCIDLREK